jgi:hypothetical protein
MNWSILAKFRRSIIVLSSTLLFIVLLRSLIDFFHPKSGGLTWAVQNLMGEEAMDWIFIYISSPSYDFLVHKIWANPYIFWLLNFCVLLLAIVLTKPKKLGAKYT